LPAHEELALDATFVGRESELSYLSQAFRAAASARRQVLFVTGPPGIGKTSLINAFCDRLQRQAVLVARGQCVNQYGVGEAYLPLLEALGRIGRGPHRSALVSVLRRHAPSWLFQLPELLEGTDGPAQPTVGSSAAPERMLREMAEALEVFALERPLILLLEDVHWAAPSTLTWIAYIARRTIRRASCCSRRTVRSRSRRVGIRSLRSSESSRSSNGAVSWRCRSFPARTWMPICRSVFPGITFPGN
jgi:predicted ATPase